MCILHTQTHTHGLSCAVVLKKAHADPKFMEEASLE